MVELTRARLGELADECGVDAVGVAAVEPMTELAGHLRNIRSKGYESGFEHPDIDERVHPERLVPDAASMIAIAISYHTADSLGLRRPKGTRGFVSKYAWGSDYHGLMREMLHRLAQAIEREVGRTIHYDTSVDTGPLVDRAVAQKAGIGWFGKNCSVITEDYGSWVFLGQIITDVRVEISDPSPWSDCGDCNLCVQACPTGALDEPYTTHSSRCLSYITQMKGMIPEEFRAPLGKRVWGCDTCQTVCPKNKSIHLGTNPAFAPDPELAYPDLRHLLELSNRAFQREFGHTAAAWRGGRVMRRNAIIALGNSRDGTAVPRLVDLLDDPHPEIRGTAAWALRKIGGGKEVRKAVSSAADRETDAAALAEMMWAHEPTEE